MTLFALEERKLSLVAKLLNIKLKINKGSCVVY